MTTLQKTNLKKWRKVTSIRNKKPMKIKKTKKVNKKTKCQVRFQFQLQRKKSESKKRKKIKRRELRKPHCSKFQLHLFYIVVEDLLGLQTALLGQRKDE